MTRLLVVSDTHLSPTAPEARTNWDAVVTYVAENPPDLVVHLGDLSLDGAHMPEDLQYARQQLDRLSVPWHVVPGNHDIGDNPWDGTPGPDTIDSPRCRRWLDTIGSDHWTLTADGWTLIALNAQLFGSRLPAETDQWIWLGDQFYGADADRPLVLITHKPLAAPDHELATAPGYRFVPPASRQRLRHLASGRRVTVVLSGHVHQHRVLHVGRVSHLWAPTTWAVLPDDVQPTFGAKRCGVVVLDLEAGANVEMAFVEPARMVQLTARDHTSCSSSGGP